MTLTTVPPERRCNATTRAGTPCKKWGMLPSGRCKFHGGKSRRGIAAPRYRHGFYSTDLACRVLWDAALRGDQIARPFIERLAAEEAARAGIDTDTP